MNRRIIALVSGGLDSTLAARMIQEQGVEVVPVYLVSPWGYNESAVAAVERRLGVPVRCIRRGREYIAVVRNPAHGYGKNLNPCVDCRVFMLRKAGSVMAEIGAAGIVTGEVVGQRPMSQLRRKLALIDRESGLDGRVVRPLSARLLAPTEPELCGVIDRKRLLAIQGRSRDEQLALAKEFGIADFPSPAGGCKLSTAGFTPKLLDFFGHYPDQALEDAYLLNYGRHFRLNEQTKLVIGRNESENSVLERFVSPERFLFQPFGFVGPSALACGEVTPDIEEMVGRMILRYVPPGGVVDDGYTIRVVTAEGERTMVAREAMSAYDVDALRIAARDALPIFAE